MRSSGPPLLRATEMHTQLRLPARVRADAAELLHFTALRGTDADGVAARAEDHRAEAVTLDPQCVLDLAARLVDDLHDRVGQTLRDHRRQMARRRAAVIVAHLDR